MREFVCGYQTLLTCGGEILGFIAFVLILLGLVVFYIADWWGTRNRRKRAPHPATCWTPLRCDGANRCWCVPSCAETAARNAQGSDIR